MTNFADATKINHAHERLFDFGQWLLAKTGGMGLKNALSDKLLDEIYISISERQLNDALKQFVVDNVDMVLDLHLKLYQDYFCLSVSVEMDGLFANVESDFRLTHSQVDARVQRMVFEQISHTRIISLHSQKSWQPPLARTALSLYHAILKKDPLPFILNQIKIKGVPFTTYKGSIIYLEIGRWLRKNRTIMGYLKKAQVNYGRIFDRQMILHAQINYGELLAFDSTIITPKDDPNHLEDDDNANSTTSGAAVASDDGTKTIDEQEDTTPDTTHAPTYVLAQQTGNALPPESIERLKAATPTPFDSHQSNHTHE